MYEVFWLLAAVSSVLLFFAIFAIVQTFPNTVKAIDKKLSDFIYGAE